MRAGLRRWLLATAILDACLVAAPAGAQMKITVGVVSRSAPNWAEYVAQRMGFFKDENISIDPILIGGVAAAAQQTTAGSLDLGNTTFEMAITAIAAGAPIAIIGATAIKYPYSLLTAATVASANDLRGKSVILPVAKNDIDNFFRMWMRDQGLANSDVDRVFDGSSTNRYAALVSGAVAGAALNSPLDFTAAAAGYRKLIDFGSYVHGYGFIGVVARKDWLARNGEAARGYLRAVSRGVDWLYEPANRDKAIDILVAETKQARDVAAQTYDSYTRLQPFSRGLTVPDADFNNVIAALVNNGMIKPSSIAKGDYVDLQYIPR